VDNATHFDPLHPSNASSPVQSGTVSLTQDLGGPPALSEVGAPLALSPFFGALARPLLQAPLPVFPSTTGDSLCHDTGPES